MNIERITPTTEETAAINELLSAQRPVTLSSLAAALGMTELEAARRLSSDQAAFVTGNASERFDEVWASLAEWTKATLFIMHEGHVFEIEAKLSTGKRAMGYYNILGKDAVVGGHIAFEQIGAIAFLNIPFMGRESLCVVFFTPDGRTSFSVYAGRENHKIIESVRTAWFAGRDAFCA